MLHWDDARFFLAALRGGSLSDAARSLGCSHTTVRRRIQSIEESLGVQLFVTTSDGLVPTDAARDAAAYAERLEESALELERVLTGASERLTGSLVVTAMDIVMEALIPSIAAFRSAYPEVSLQFVTDNRYFDLGRREADIAVRITNSPDPALFGCRVGQFRFAPFAHPELARAHGAHLERFPWIMWHERSGASMTEEWFRRLGTGSPAAMRVTNGATMMALLQGGLGAAIVPLVVGARQGLVQLADELEGFASDIWCLTHEDMRGSARVRAFMRVVAEHALFGAHVALES